MFRLEIYMALYIERDATTVPESIKIKKKYIFLYLTIYLKIVLPIKQCLPQRFGQMKQTCLI